MQVAPSSRFFFLFPVISFVLTCCQTVVELDLPEKPASLVVNGFFNPDSVFSVSVSKSQYILDNAPITKINNAVVSVFDGDVFLEQLSFYSDGNYFSSQNIKPQAGKKYKLTVSASGFNQAEATDAAPAGTEITGVDTGNFFFENEKYFEVKIRFRDNPAENNFYHLQLFGSFRFFIFDSTGQQVIDTISYNEPTEFQSRDLIFDDKNWFDNSGAMFSDELFATKGEYQLSVYLYAYSYSPDTAMGSYSFDELEVSLKSVSRDYYRYVVSYQKYKESNGNPFAEPVQVFNNVSNGFGIFAGYSGTRYTINLH